MLMAVSGAHKLAVAAATLAGGTVMPALASPAHIIGWHVPVAAKNMHAADNYTPVFAGNSRISSSNLKFPLKYFHFSL